MNNSNIFVISAPSGAGKSSIIKNVCEKHCEIQLSISHTTREPRIGEINGKNYYFISKTEFTHMLNEGEFIEHANVFGNFYGTNYKTIKKFIETGKDLILEIDWQGAFQIKDLFPESILIFILPPSIEELENRLKNRNTDNAETINKRLKVAHFEITKAEKYDYIIINENFHKASDDLYSIIYVQQLKSKRILNDYKI